MDGVAACSCRAASELRITCIIAVVESGPLPMSGVLPGPAGLPLAGLLLAGVVGCSWSVRMSLSEADGAWCCLDWASASHAMTTFSIMRITCT